MRLSSRAAVVSTVLLLCSLAAGAAAKPALWTVHGGQGTLVLFGSVHLLPKGLDWRPPALEAALSKADDIWFELPIDEATDQTASRSIAARGRLPRGRNLWSLLDADTNARVEAAAEVVGIPREALGPMRPWLAELTLSLAADAKSGARAGDGVEIELQNDAPPKARRHALETVRDQLDFLSGGSIAEQIASLRQTALEITTDPDIYARTVREWLEGDLAGIAHDDLDTMRASAPGAYRRLIVERNRRWARRLARQARRKGVTLVVVGAGHLIGPEGLPTLLRARGFQVEGP